MRPLPLAALLALSACGEDRSIPGNSLPNLTVMSETPGDWSDLEGMIGKSPAESGLFEDSPIAVDVNATLGPDLRRFHDAMMRAGPLTREGPLLVARAPDAWLVLEPADHAFRAALRERGQWREWQTPGADVPRPG